MAPVLIRVGVVAPARKGGPILKVIHDDQLDEHGRRLVVRNGHHREREVTTAAGAVPVRAPRVNDKRIDAVAGRCAVLVGDPAGLAGKSLGGGGGADAAVPARPVDR
jgi:hypothetical protein